MIARSALAAGVFALSLSACSPTADTGLGSLSQLQAFAPLGDISASRSVTARSGVQLASRLDALQLPPTRGQRVAYAGSEKPGTIVIETIRPALYFVEEGGMAMKYPVAVGRQEHQWFGEKPVQGLYFKPAWSPPDVIRRANPNVPDLIAGGEPNNPMGVGAIVLAGGEYAIHGTNRPDSIGRAVSFGCFRMFNEDIADLIRRVNVGTEVIVRR